MKTYIPQILLFTLLGCQIVSAQEKKQLVPMTDGKVIYSEVAEVPGTKDEIYAKAKLWFANSFKSAKDVLQLDDKENGILLGKGLEQRGGGNVLAPTLQTWRFTIKIQLKDGKYKADIYDLNHTFEMPGNRTYAPTSSTLDEYFNNPKICKSDGSVKPVVQKFADDTSEICNSMLANIKKSLSEKIKKDDF